MRKGRYFLILIVCAAVLALSWILVISEKTDEEIQTELIQKATLLLEDKIYIRAQPLLEEAAGYGGAKALEAEQLLKSVYNGLISDSGYANKLASLYAQQLSRDDLPAELYLEAADYYLDLGKKTEAIRALRMGTERTGDPRVEARYEQERYSYVYSGKTFQDVTEVYNDYIQVKQLELWGLASYSGDIVIPCAYEKISTFSTEMAVGLQNGEIFSIDAENHRLYLQKAPVLDFGNFGNGMLGFLTENGWVRGDGQFNMGSVAFDSLGMYNSGYAAAESNGKWGVIDSEAEWIIPPEYDEIIMDAIGRCWEQDAVFARDGKDVYLFLDGKRQDEVYEDAWPFYEQGWAAVKKNGLWGYIDAQGQMIIDCQYADARSFSGHLGAVKINDNWGYISLNNELVIDDLFLDVRAFVNGCAAVRNLDGWQFLILDEYREE